MTIEDVARRLRRRLHLASSPVTTSSDAPANGAVPMFVAPGHFYSPIPSVTDIEAFRARAQGPRPDALGALELRLDEQIALLDSFRGFYDEHPFPVERTAELRFWFDNPSFSYADALALYCMLRWLRPKRVIEVGSGWSSCVLLDTSERYLDWSPHITMVEPYPDQLHQLVHPGDLDRVDLLADPVQQVPLSMFTSLGDGDVLVIDSTHVSRVGSDVNYEIFEVLPALQPGVYVHFHDIFYPFEYPLQWV
ncbi:MAG: class I SAM-dependent methyltransferase, partial [Acidimicrobiia bacterium]